MEDEEHKEEGGEGTMIFGFMVSDRGTNYLQLPNTGDKKVAERRKMYVQCCPVTGRLIAEEWLYSWSMNFKIENRNPYLRGSAGGLYSTYCHNLLERYYCGTRF